MGIETIDSIGEQAGEVERDGYGEVVRQALRAAQIHTSTPIDGGWGASITDAHEVRTGAFPATTGISYAGEIPVEPDSPPDGFRPFPTMP